MGAMLQTALAREWPTACALPGIDENTVSEIREALETWQQPARLEKEVHNLLRHTRKVLKSLKDMLTPQICEDGRKWHGYESRLPRKLTRTRNS